MKKLFLIIGILCLFTGCTQPEPTTTQATAAQTAAVTEPTQPPTTVPATEAPGFDPMDLVQTMTTEEKVGQMFLARCPDLNAVGAVQTYHLGGFVLFGRDFQDQTPMSVSFNIADYQAASRIPLLIAVDEEGGTVTRVSYYSAFRDSRFPSPRNAWQAGGLTNVQELEAEKCQLLQSLGINVNLGPVCDITTDPGSFMYDRSLGQDAQTTADFVEGVVHTMQQYSIGSTLKHFPGYGNNTDTHVGMALDTRSLEELEGADLIPFQAGIDAGCGAIMVSHTFVNCLDSEYPASLSPAVHAYLRETMGFTGVIVTDDLIMQAITDLYGAEEAAVLAVLAGNDLLCASDYPTQYPAVLEAVNSGRIPMETVDQAVARILQWKYDLGLLEALQ